MAIELKYSQLVTLFQEFFRDSTLTPKINSIADLYPDEQSLLINYWDIEKYNTNISELLLETPVLTILASEQAIKDVLPPEHKGKCINVRIINLPKLTNKISIRNIRRNHIGKFIAVEGLIRRITDVRPKLLDAHFQCQSCTKIIHIPQTESTIVKEPWTCLKDQGGCGKSCTQTSFKLLKRESEWQDTQKVELQEYPENLQGNEQPQRLIFIISKDLCGKITAGDRVVINGILEVKEKYKGNNVKLDFDLQIFANSVEFQQQSISNIDITPEDEKEILQYSTKEDIYTELTKFVAPSIYGLETEKEMLVLQQFGGVAIDTDTNHIRGDIHVLFIGDAGTAKSQLLKFTKAISSRSVYCSGKGASAAGLTACVTKDEFGEGKFTLEAGALVLANGGGAIIDEMDKMEKDDRSAMHEAMEQQQISVNKGGINATLNSRCFILAAANPKDGRFNQYSNPVSQINLPPPLLSRFDVILPFRDIPDEDKDSKIAGHILMTHKKNLPTEENKTIKTIAIGITIDLFKKYVSYARMNITPTMPDECANYLNEYYTKLRKMYSDSQDATIPITPRQFESLIRMSEASAKIQLRKEINISDIERAKRIYEYYLKNLNPDKMDIDVVCSGSSSKERDRIRIIQEIILTEQQKTKEGVDINVISNIALDQYQITIPVTKSILERLYRDSRIYMPKEDLFKIPI